METSTYHNHIIIAPQIYVSLEPPKTGGQTEESKLRQTKIPMVWSQDGDDFRLDIDLPDSSVLDVFFSSQVGSLHINGETIWENNCVHSVRMPGAHAEMTPGGLRLTCTSSGSIHILARCLLEIDPKAPLKIQNKVQ
jgi:hypothetical protein